MNNFKKIAQLPLFKDLTTNQLEILLTNSHYLIKKYRKGASIAMRGDHISHLIYLLSGSLQSTMNDINGNVKQIERFNHFEIIAPAFLFGEQSVFPVNLIAVENSELLMIPKDQFLLMMQQDQAILMAFLKLISNKTQLLTKKIWFSFSKRTIREKIMSYFMQNSINDTVKLKMNLTQLAQLFDITRPSLSRELRKMIKEGIIKQIDSKNYQIIDILEG